MEDTYLEQQPIPGYRLELRLGTGGQASVYKAIQLSMNRPVAIKIIRPGADGSSVELGRFMREAQVLARLRHDNVVQAIDFGEVSGHRYFVMEFLEGEPVAEIQKRQVFLPVAQSLDVAAQVCRALDHAFRFNVIHRDIKPANIVLVNGQRAVLVDFGLARPEQSDMQVTMAGMTVGTPHYMAPEQIRGDPNLDTRVDIYALGGTLFHMVTGCPPFPHQQKTQILIAHLKDPVLLPEKLPQEVPQDVFAIVKKAMRKEREKRYQNPEEMLRDLERILDRLGVRGERRTAQAAVKILTPMAPSAAPVAAPSAQFQDLAAKAEEMQRKAREILQQKQKELDEALRRVADLERKLREAEAKETMARQRAEDLEQRLMTALVKGRPAAKEEPISDAIAIEDEGEVIETEGEIVEEGEDDGDVEEVSPSPAIEPVPEEVFEPAFAPEEVESAPEPERREVPMVRVPKGAFIAGENGAKDADPRQEITLPAFWIDVHPVTNRDYLDFVRATGRTPPDHFKGGVPAEEMLDHPVVWVTWQDATDFAAWAGKRLPTRVEWQKAARGPDGRTFPWGNQVDVRRCNCKESGPGKTTPVGGYPTGVSPFGIHDAAGNVAEWVAGEIMVPGADRKQVVRAVCGGSWRDPLERSRCASRRGYPDGGKAPYVGFRCARD
ncbi:MAG: SUMF1/EgtB/PvdO family nonheme iron enzyme [Planctomycetes bacterium]|nr:SUMF1/EgtB/PvdO family nonheme iron enzyme [Planctomycetota bacterium]